jgi:pyruvate dehydrogenase E1 component alpha subunit
MRTRETRMANDEREVGAVPLAEPGPPGVAPKRTPGADVPAGGFIQLLTPDGERIDSVTTADGTTY